MIYHDGPNDLLMAAGLFNQRLYVIPSREMVVVRFGRADATWSDAEFLARLLDGRDYDAPPRKQVPLDERVELITTLRLRQLDRAVDLTREQESALRPIVAKQMRALATMRRAREETSRVRQERRRLFWRLRDIQRQTDRAIEAELSPNQVEAYRAFRAEQRERWRQAGQERR
jgi:hypothetical protein